jgi:hypothetical protein
VAAAFDGVLCRLSDWTLARIIVALDKPQVTGDILRRIGNYTCRIANSNDAEAEAEKEKKAGRVPH